MSKESRERQRLRDEAAARAKPKSGGQGQIGIGAIQLSKAKFEDIPAGPARDAVAILRGRYPEGLVVRNREEWGWASEVNGKLMLWSANETGAVQEHQIPYPFPMISDRN